MMRNRFFEISKYLHFNNSASKPKCGEDGYGLYKIGPVLDYLKTEFQELYSPGKNLSVDEAMVGYKGRPSFKQYMHTKPTNYGFKVWMAADSANGYALNYEVYLGKDKDGEHSMENGLGYYVVMSTTKPYWNKFHDVFFHNFFNSPKLLVNLMNKNTYTSGMVKPKYKELPPPQSNKLNPGEKVVLQKG